MTLFSIAKKHGILIKAVVRTDNPGVAGHPIALDRLEDEMETPRRFLLTMKEELAALKAELTVPAAEYVPAISDAWATIDRMTKKVDAALAHPDGGKAEHTCHKDGNDGGCPGCGKQRSERDARGLPHDPTRRDKPEGGKAVGEK